jgi:hypothetical protein
MPSALRGPSTSQNHQMTTTTAPTRPACLPEKILLQVQHSHWALVEAIAIGDGLDLANALADLTQDIECLEEDHPADFEYVTGSSTPAQLVARHLAHLLG